jgi:hypothetical protein
MNITRPLPVHSQIDTKQINSVKSDSIDSEVSSYNSSTVTSIKNEVSIGLSVTKEDLIANEKYMDEWWELQKREKVEAENMLKSTQNVLKEISEEQPSLLRKEFDFTHNGEEIEVINHNLSQKEYNYLKDKLNDNQNLVEALDFLNERAAYENTLSRNDDKVYTKEDIAGRIHVMDILKEAERRSSVFEELHRPGVVMEPYDKRARFHQDVHLNALDILKGTSAQLSTRA